VRAPPAKPGTIEPIVYVEPDLDAELADAEAQVHEASIFHEAAALKAERVMKALVVGQPAATWR
jgi:hypothetical protein